ncbi:initiation-specific alpha-1,6-mannosyltransferase [Colletotrichum fioriniae PJ7]|uniref:Initiation-specific alpha-1,6-mannosyltransferase n=1 Tax=Colletotrichum fioriniae PJ7 TaxID=1445577 RepID=A0A010RZZ5_9PEZI|nr:initiation-specific alpha-1,6-mannosyltransferase [Colletotrichum fioriniae PJ7]
MDSTKKVQASVINAGCRISRPASSRRVPVIIAAVLLISISTYFLHGLHDGVLRRSFVVSPLQQMLYGPSISCANEHHPYSWSLSLSEHSIPPHIWQISLPTANGMDNPVRWTTMEHISTWLALNGGHTYALVDGRSSNSFVKSHYGNTSDVYHTYEQLSNAGMGSSLLRYLLLEAGGGTYTDLDTIALKPIMTWVPGHLRSQVRLVVGIIYDQQDHAPRKDKTYPLLFAHSTIAAAPGHPVIHNMISQVVTSMRRPTVQDGVDEAKDWPGNLDISYITGSAVWTKVLFDYLQSVNSDLTDIMSFSYLERPTLCGDVLILPIDSFGMGQNHSGSTNNGQIPDNALASRLIPGWPILKSCGVIDRCH